MIIKSNLVDIENKEIYPAEILIENKRILSIKPINEVFKHYLLPGFIDAHVHVESSLLIPSEFARLAVLHGTVASVSDPHEIANVCGMDGVMFMIENAKQTPFKFFFGAPSCVPATTFETAGATLTEAAVETLIHHPSIWYLSEMMNFPGVLQQYPEVMAKLGSAKKANKPIDGHAPGLTGSAAEAYFANGISTDHECYTIEEALDKIKLGVNILIREGSAAKNFNALIPLMHDYVNQLMFCSDDKHPDELAIWHINKLVSRAIKSGYPLFSVLQAACINPVKHYKLPVGLLKEGNLADFILVNNLTDFDVLATYINGELVAKEKQSFIPSVPTQAINNFKAEPITTNMLKYVPKVNQQVIECLDGQLITNKLNIPSYLCNEANDVLKLVVINRYEPKAKPAIAYIKNMGIKNGAIASSVAHDSHNIIATGTSDELIAAAINLVIKAQGGLSAVSKEEQHILPLPFAGLMSGEDGFKVAAKYSVLDNFVKSKLKSTLAAPYMSLSFMALLVIPHLKLSDKGLFDGDTFEFI
jgi:adenine deaminase